MNDPDEHIGQTMRINMKTGEHTLKPDAPSEPAPVSGSRRTCEICGAKVRNRNPRTTTCDPICTAAKHAKRTRQQQLAWEMANPQCDGYKGEI